MSGYEWVWQPFAAQSSAALTAIASRIAYLIATGPVYLIPDDAECIDTRIGLPIAARSFSGSWINRVDELPQEIREMIEALVSPPKPKNESLHDLVWRQTLSGAFFKAGQNDEPSTQASLLTTSLLDHLLSEQRCRRIVELLNWPVRATVVSALTSPHANRWLNVEREWTGVAAVPRSSRPQWVTAAIVAVDALATTSGIAIYRDIRTIAGSLPLGPTWLAWLGLACFSILIIYALTAVLELGFDVDAFDVFDSDVPFRAGLTVSGAALVYGIVVSAITVATWIGWPAVVGILILTTALIAGTVWWAVYREKIQSNVFRPILNADRHGWLARRSVIAAGDVG